MRLQIEPSDIFVTVDGVRCRVWNGVTENNEQVFVFVVRVAVPNADRSGLEERLIEMPPPKVMPEQEERKK